MTELQLKELSHSGLYRRRRDRPDSLRLTGLPEEGLSSKAPMMAFPSRVHHPSEIPKKEEIPQTALSSVRQANGNEDERAVSKLQRRQSDVKVYKEFCDFYAKFNMANALANATCERCRGGFAPAEKIVNSNGELYHEQCFVCAQCFQQFPEGLFYEADSTDQVKKGLDRPGARSRPNVEAEVDTANWFNIQSRRLIWTRLFEFQK
ncbi:LIM and senescent cell antigen-like-containing domain protein 3 [Myotis brandtii]|uniref:LIM and senescent cell antigen-like-containing domain protein 3 n=1 Tax=Myotis brandtii TaxID=109478 RepID=S7NND3_MYOBR|nr:LIM and senescent cell antigen-like-containing domain protein 3 [Myotis brandtii]